MIKINREIANSLFEVIGYGNIGIYCSQGAVIGDNNEFVIVYTEETQEVFLAHISDFEQDGLLIRLKNENK